MMARTKEEILTASALTLSSHPYQTVSLELVAREARASLAEVARHFPTMHALGTAILTREGASMRAAHKQAQEIAQDPLDCLREAFRLVGRNLSREPIVRAGIRIAAEAHSCFPERDINPFRTWRAFVIRNLELARSGGLLRANIDIEDAAWLLVSSGMGTKDLLAFTDTWDDAEARLSQTAKLVLESIRRSE
ncbi:TetR/AcrR family transcriptional regulator [Brevibacterium luteolum]|uniref:TetR/AcrR family transcriptional regulator n=1 Tax=Brevibacterium luteolum TaxID=199591 RepID=UPI001C21B069|nr:TetR/AcrR family transcriptional regulator [Brevibacterium luteolum]MBU8579700.1 hypothetical protein [Brevibacterium luteolum]